MDIGRVQRRFTSEPIDSPVPGTPEAPVEQIDADEHAQPTTVTADARS
ncbi:hypothetical protein WCD74_01955 [Actinomycetospora sp. OC33-EN08]|uniref:Uncharacterized protein n=1 Tax=Actinomycetospora aurantiaca TaxID=3129233 RepID=A0ABU8MHQ5_9PSEU